MKKWTIGLSIIIISALMGILSSFLQNELIVSIIFLVIKIYVLYPFFVIMYFLLLG